LTKFPVFTRVTGNWAPETGSLETVSSSGESATNCTGGGLRWSAAAIHATHERSRSWRDRTARGGTRRFESCCKQRVPSALAVTNGIVRVPLERNVRIVSRHPRVERIVQEQVAPASICRSGHKDDAWSFPHFDTITVSVADAPRHDEIVFVIAIADGGRLLQPLRHGARTVTVDGRW
jgi:amino acid synthesis protein